MRKWSLKEATRRTGLTRRQLRYLEERGLLGFVARDSGHTYYDETQSCLLEHIARLRPLGVRIEEAAQIAGEIGGGAQVVASERLDELAGKALASVERNSRAAADLVALRQRRGLLRR